MPTLRRDDTALPSIPSHAPCRASDTLAAAPLRRSELIALRALVGLPNPSELVRAHWQRLSFEERAETLWGAFSGGWLAGRLGDGCAAAAREGDDFTRAVLGAALADGARAAQRMLRSVADRAREMGDGIEIRAARRFLGRLFTLDPQAAVSFALMLPNELAERCGIASQPDTAVFDASTRRAA